MPRDLTVESAVDDAFYEALLEDSPEDLYENAPCGYLSSRPDGTIIKVNATFLAWTGYTVSDLVPRRRLQSLLAPGDQIFYETHYAPLLRMQGAVREIAVEIVRADGTRLPVLVNAITKTDDAGHPAVVRTAVFDARDRREYERELLRARDRAEQSEAEARVLARTLQESLIPPEPPSVPGIDVAGVYRPAGHGHEVGGDFYDVFETARDDWAVVLGDVEGKGAAAATVTALARYTVRAAAMRTRQPRLVLRMLNAALRRQNADRFCTAVYARIRPRNGGARLTIAAAGHPLPLRATRADRPTAVGRPGGLLGVVEDPELHDSSIDLGPGDVVVLYTDGVTEGRGESGFFGEDRLADVVAGHRHEPAAGVAQAVVDAVVGFQGGLPRDDIAVVVLTVPEA